MDYENFWIVPHDPDDETFTSVDYKTGPFDVLEKVAELLLPFGLKVMVADSGNDQYPFKIEREKPDASDDMIAALRLVQRDVRGQTSSCGVVPNTTMHVIYAALEKAGQQP